MYQAPPLKPTLSKSFTLPDIEQPVRQKKSLGKHIDDVIHDFVEKKKQEEIIALTQHSSQEKQMKAKKKQAKFESKKRSVSADITS